MAARQRSSWSRSLATIVLLFALCTLIPRAVHATGTTTITQFYPASKQSYDLWPGKKFAPPAQLSVFPTSTAIVAFYIAFTGAVPNVSRIQASIRDQSGATLVVGKAFSPAVSNGPEMIWIKAPRKGVYSDGTYTADLSLNGAVAVHTQFTVGSQPSTATSGQSSMTVPTFYTTTSAAQNSWATFKYLPPSPVNTFFSGTTAVAFYFEYLGAAPGATHIQVQVVSSSGTVVAIGQALTINQYAGDNLLSLTTATKTAFADGSYIANLLINGTITTSHSFSVGRNPGSAYILFYPTTAAATTAWASNKYMPLPQVHTFPSKTATVSFYFTYTNVIANADFYQIIVSDAKGTTIFNGTASFFTADSGELAQPAQPKTGFLTGAYKATLYIDSFAALSTSFTIS